MHSTICLGRSVPLVPSNRFHATVHHKHRGAYRSVVSRRICSTAGDDAPGPDDDTEDKSSLPPEDVDLVVDFYTRRSSKKKETPKENTTKAENADSSGGGGSGSTGGEPEVLKLEAPQEDVDSAPAGLLPTEAESLHDDSNEDESTHKKHHHHRHRIHELQDQLLALLATLDRGLAASRDDVTKVENLALQLENAGGPVILDIASNSTSANNERKKSGMELLNGRWRLAYSSGFSGGNLGGRRPGPPAALVPLTVGAVYQDIFVSAKELDNVVTLTAKLSLASFFQAEPPSVTARLKHSFSIEGAATVRIVFERTLAQTSGGIGGWLDSLPQFATPMLPESLRPVTAPSRDATFDVTFLDDRMRITRGDRGELRVFVKES